MLKSLCVCHATLLGSLETSTHGRHVGARCVECGRVQERRGGFDTANEEPQCAKNECELDASYYKCRFHLLSPCVLLTRMIMDE